MLGKVRLSPRNDNGGTDSASPIANTSINAAKPAKRSFFSGCKHWFPGNWWCQLSSHIIQSLIMVANLIPWWRCRVLTVYSSGTAWVILRWNMPC